MHLVAVYVAQENGGGLGGLFCLMIFWLAIVAVVFVSLWKVFEKAGRPGWEGIVPIYNAYILITEIVGRPWWWLLLLFIPCVGIVFGVILAIDLARSFGQGTGFGIGLALLSIVFFPILAFGDYRYIGKGALLPPGGSFGFPVGGPPPPPPPPR